ncbi:MAG: TolB family protein [Planctomycetota bacterium]|jgi:Tol biopolymer transport system component
MWEKKSVLLILAGLLSATCLGQSEYKKGKSPLDELPPYIKQVTHFGQRADWSHDGRRILFLEKTFGDAYEIDLETNVIRLLTGRYYHEGYVRALYLANGDILLAGARKFDAEDPVPSRKKYAELWVLKKDLSEPPTALGEYCYEGPAVSRKNMRIAWTVRGTGPDATFYIADIIYENGKPKLANKKKIVQKSDLSIMKYDIETQNFRPPDEKELIFSAYGDEYKVCEVAGLDIETGKAVNYSKAPGRYDEPEGIFPDGKHTLVECDAHSDKGAGDIDIYKLALDGSGKIERLTSFGDYPGYKSSNPVVSDDGRYMAFQYARKGDWAGVGRGILIFDLAMYEKMKKSRQK